MGSASETNKIVFCVKQKMREPAPKIQVVTSYLILSLSLKNRNCPAQAPDRELESSRLADDDHPIRRTFSNLA
jgi:hypothetical protein